MQKRQTRNWKVENTEKKEKRIIIIIIKHMQKREE